MEARTMSLNDLRPGRMRSATTPKKAFDEEFEFGWKAGNQFQVLDEADLSRHQFM